MPYDIVIIARSEDILLDAKYLAVLVALEDRDSWDLHSVSLLVAHVRRERGSFAGEHLEPPTSASRELLLDRRWVWRNDGKSRSILEVWYHPVETIGPHRTVRASSS